MRRGPSLSLCNPLMPPRSLSNQTVLDGVPQGGGDSQGVSVKEREVALEG